MQVPPRLKREGSFLEEGGGGEEFTTGWEVATFWDYNDGRFILFHATLAVVALKSLVMIKSS